MLFLVFNRPVTTRRVFEVIRKAQPPRLYVAADGPRVQKAGELERCVEVRQIMSEIDWPCTVKTLYRDENLGCKKAVSQGISWFFEHEEEGIILEDDCLPSSSFFAFCDELLERYRHDERVAQIGGVNFQAGKPRMDWSYYFSRYNHIWGWASWRRAWKWYDVDIALWEDVKKGGWLEDIGFSDAEARFWESAFEGVAKGKIDTWDYQWTFACWINSALTALPNSNLVSNIGFGPGATHTVNPSEYSGRSVCEIGFPLVHPAMTIRDSRADSHTSRQQFEIPSLPHRVFRRLSRIGRRGKTAAVNLV